MLSKALIINTDANPPLPIPVQFNPPEYQIQRSNEFAEIRIPGLGSSLLQFVSGGAQTLTIELFFDTTGRGVDVRVFTDLITDLALVNSETHAPPRLVFLWGSLIFPCILEGFTERFEYFSTSGLPLRARLSVTLKSFDTIENLLANMSLQSADRTKRHIFVQGETLSAIAATEYGDARNWRPIARASGIDNPLTIQPGRPLTVPVLK